MNRKTQGLGSLHSGIQAGLKAYAGGGPVQHFSAGSGVGKNPSDYSPSGFDFLDYIYDNFGAATTGGAQEVFVDATRIPSGGMFGGFDSAAGTGNSFGGGYYGTDSGGISPTVLDALQGPTTGSWVPPADGEGEWIDDGYGGYWSPAPPKWVPAEPSMQTTIDPVTITAPDYTNDPGVLASIAAGLGNASDFLSHPIKSIINAATGRSVSAADTQKQFDALGNLLTPNETFTSDRITTTPIDEIIVPGSRYTYPVDPTASPNTPINYGPDPHADSGSAPIDEVVVTASRPTGPETVDLPGFTITTPPSDVAAPSLPPVDDINIVDSPATLPPTSPVTPDPMLSGGSGGISSGSSGATGFRGYTGKKDWTPKEASPQLGTYRSSPLVQTGTDSSSGMNVQTYAPGALQDYLARLKKLQSGPQTEGIGGVEYQTLPGEGMASGGMASLPEYRAGGKLLRGPGDGMSDSIPAMIHGEEPQQAALADGEFVVPADVVSHLGNGSTEAGAKLLYAMMDKIRHARTGKKQQAPAVKASKFLPA